MEVPNGWYEVLRGPRPPSVRWPVSRGSAVNLNRAASLASEWMAHTKGKSRFPWIQGRWWFHGQHAWKIDEAGMKRPRVEGGVQHVGQVEKVFRQVRSERCSCWRGQSPRPIVHPVAPRHQFGTLRPPRSIQADSARWMRTRWMRPRWAASRP